MGVDDGDEGGGVGSGASVALICSCVSLFIPPVARSTTNPMRPPKRIFPNIRPLAFLVRVVS